MCCVTQGLFFVALRFSMDRDESGITLLLPHDFQAQASTPPVKPVSSEYKHFTYRDHHNSNSHHQNGHGHSRARGYDARRQSQHCHYRHVGRSICHWRHCRHPVHRRRLSLHSQAQTTQKGPGSLTTPNGNRDSPPSSTAEAKQLRPVGRRGDV